MFLLVMSWRREDKRLDCPSLGGRWSYALPDAKMSALAFRAAMAPPVEPPLTRLGLPWKRLLIESCLVGRWLTLCVYRAQQALWAFEFEHHLLPAPLLRRKFRDWVGSNEYGGRIWVLVELYLNKLGIKGNLGRIFSSIRIADPWKVSLQLQGADTLHRLNWADLDYWTTTLPADCLRIRPGACGTS